MKLRPLLATVAQACAIVLASPASAAPREPTHKWVVDYAEQQCVASRNYGTADQPLFVALKPAPVGDLIQLTVLRKTNHRNEIVEEVSGQVRADNKRPLQVTMLSYISKDGFKSMRINLSADQFSTIRGATVLHVSGTDIDETLKLTQVPQLMQALDACVADLQALYNIAPGAAEKLKSRASLPHGLIGFFSSEDYPGIALFRREGGRVGLVLLVDEKGMVADCVVTETSGVASLDFQACAVIAHRARFIPAVGADGKPARDSYTQRVTWKTANGG